MAESSCFPTNAVCGALITMSDDGKTEMLITLPLRWLSANYESSGGHNETFVYLPRVLKHYVSWDKPEWASRRHVVREAYVCMSVCLYVYTTYYSPVSNRKFMSLKSSKLNHVYLSLTISTSMAVTSSWTKWRPLMDLLLLMCSNNLWISAVWSINVNLSFIILPSFVVHNFSINDKCSKAIYNL